MSDPDLMEPGAELETIAALNTALSRLPVEQREAIELAVGAGMNYRQIAERMGIEGTAVQRHIHRGLLALLFALRDYPYLEQLKQSESDRS